ncbi:MAG TPA: mechanosensitive ion channel domain-containing protein [Candidatus Thermoplasmatota archaeon]|nr:mechanosensitive ion channel domain-containing protein [Candidatus Thermoplasmatota archaeon]
MRVAWAWLLLGLVAAAPLGAAQESTEPASRLVLEQWQNPLPPPLDGAFGTFLLNVLAWLILASFARLLIGPVLQLAAKRTKTTVDDTLIDILGTPLFVVILFVGVRASLDAFTLQSGLVQALDILGSLIVIVVVGYILFRAWNEVALDYAKRLAHRTNGTLDNRLVPLLEKFGGLVIVLLAATFFMRALGVGFGWVLAGGAFASLVIGLAAQDTLSNFFSGIHLLVDQPFQEGDEIQLESGEVCTVRRVGLRSSHLYNGQTHEMLIVPNNLLATNKVTNLMRPDRKHRVWLDVGVVYGADADVVRRLMTEAALAHPKVLREPGNEPQARLIDFGPPALRYSLIFWVGDHKERNPVASDLRIAILRRFKEADIQMPTVAIPIITDQTR